MRRLATAAGLALLYASAYFLPFLTPFALYFVPAFFSYVVFPSLVSIVVLTPVFYFLSRPRPQARWHRILLFWGAAALTIIALKSILDAAGYPWMNLLKAIPAEAQPAGPGYARWGRIALIGTALIAALLFVYAVRKRLPQWIRFLSTLGYAFLFLATYRCLTSDLLLPAMERTPSAASATAPAPPRVPRRVIWVIFDEMDYALSMGPDARSAERLPNFARLARKSVSAANAHAPGRDTLYSIPALLMGKPVSGVTLSARSPLAIRTLEGTPLPFGLPHSVFDSIPGGPGSASILGFYHPYCKVFPGLQACHSSYLGNAGRWFDSLTFFSEAIFSTLRHLKGAVQSMPESLLYQFDPMYRVSSATLSQLDRSMANQSSSLDFIHLNVPHLPNVYVQRLLQQPAGNDKDAYAQNLAGADMLLGRIVSTLEAQAEHQEILLIVSSDHWLRPHSAVPASVPFMAWRVGDSAGRTVAQRFSTVHSAGIAVDFLAGKLDSQADVAERMARSTYYETWMSPDDYKY